MLLATASAAGETPAVEVTAEAPVLTPVQRLAAALVEAGSTAERDALLARSSELIVSDLWRELYALGDPLRIRGDYDGALRAYREAQRMAERLGDFPGVAQSLNGEATVYLDRAELEQGAACIERSLDLARSMGDRGAEARALGLRGRLHFRRSELDSAQRDYEQSLALWSELGDEYWIAEVHNALGNVWGARHALQRALEYYELALATHEKRKDPAAIAGMLNNIATLHLAAGSYRVAADDLRRALAIEEAGGYRRLEAMTVLNLASIDMVLGDFARSLEGYLRALHLQEELGNQRDTGKVLNNIGSLYRQQGSYDIALDYFERAMSVHRTNDDPDGTGESLFNLALLSRAQSRHDAALDYAQRSLEIYERIGRRGNAAAVLRCLGGIHLDRSDHAASRLHYQRSIDLYQEIGSRSGVADVQGDLAALEAAEGRDDEALRLATLAAQAGREMRIPDLLWRASTRLGTVETRRGRPDAARRAFDEAIAAIEGLRENVAGGDLDRPSFFEERVEPYQRLVSLLVAEGDLAGAFAYVERTKARALLDVLERSQTTVRGAMTAGEAAREQALVERLALLNSELYAAMTGDAAATDKSEVERGVERARLDLASLRSELYNAHPSLEVSRGHVPPVDVDEAFALVDSPARALLSFFVTPEATYLFVLAQDPATGLPRLTAHPIRVQQEVLAREVEAFRGALARLDPRFTEPARRLYDQLLAPAAEEIAGRTDLVIVPDGVLWELPFQALTPAARHYLVEAHAISYAPSLAVLAAVRARSDERDGTASPRTLLAFGNPDFGVETRRRAEHVLMGGKLDPLPEAGRQVEALAKLYGAERARIYVGAEAREDRAKAEADRYRIVQFATHGTLNDANPMYSHLVLAHPVGDGEDGLLEAWEMMDLDLDADLVVLAACETARGRVRAGEGVVGMSWALFAAGASATVVSQWKVESASTTDLMVAFHRELERRPEGAAAMPAEALRQASLLLLRDPRYRHPFYWAGFVVIGASSGVPGGPS